MQGAEAALRALKDRLQPAHLDLRDAAPAVQQAAGQGTRAAVMQGGRPKVRVTTTPTRITVSATGPGSSVVLGRVRAVLPVVRQDAARILREQVRAQLRGHR